MCQRSVFFHHLSSAGGKNAQVIMVTGSADGAFGILFPFFDVQVWPFSAIDSVTLFLLHLLMEMDCDGVLDHQLGAQQHLGAQIQSSFKHKHILSYEFQSEHLHILKEHSCKCSSWLDLLFSKQRLTFNKSLWLKAFDLVCNSHSVLLSCQ